MNHDLTSTADLQKLDRATILHPFTELKRFSSGEAGEPRIISGGAGIRVRDRDGNELLDAFAGRYCVNVGYGRREIADAIHRQALELPYYPAYAGYSTEPAIHLAERVLAMTPGRMKRIYYGLSGSDANETQLKIVWYYNNVLGRPEKKKIISRWRGYHGGTVMSGSLTGLDTHHRAFDLPQGPILHTITPHYYWHAEPGMDEREFSRVCAARLEALIQTEGPDTVAAFIGEPVLATGGLIPPPQGYWEEIQQVLRRYDILLIADEVVCGFGRMGKPFGSHVYGIEPDLVTVGKGITSGYLPLSGAIIGEKVWKVLEQGSDTYGVFGHGYTFSAHPLCATAALANLDIIEREHLTEHVAEIAPYFLQRLKETFSGRPYVAEVRGAGLLGAIEFAQDPSQRARFDPAHKVGLQLAAACLEERVIVRAMPHGDILGLAPALIVTREDVDEIISRVARAVERVTRKL
ncbi:MAG: bioA [Gammaproteobacteria bacterium]|jgi:L-2,4-diaminobutyrate transaminase|nr:bioA [Gammaproteobacteria bacterium]